MKHAFTLLLLLAISFGCKKRTYTDENFAGKTFAVTVLKLDPERDYEHTVESLNGMQLMFLADEKGVISDPGGQQADRTFSWYLDKDDDSTMHMTPEHKVLTRTTIYQTAKGYKLIDNMRSESDTANRYELLLTPVPVTQKPYPEKKLEGKTFRATVVKSNPDRENHQTVMALDGMQLVFKGKEEGSLQDPSGKESDQYFNWTVIGSEQSQALLLGLRPKKLFGKIYLTKTGYTLIDTSPSLDDTTARFEIELKQVDK